MEVWEAQHVRTQAMVRLDDGDLPGARKDLDDLIARLEASPSKLPMELASALSDRATVERFANDWDGALADLDAADAIAVGLPFIARKAVLTNVYLLRAKIRSTRFLTAFDLPRARKDLDELAKLWPSHWMVIELESHLAFQNREWQRAAEKALLAAASLETEGWARGVAACRRRAGDAFLELGDLDRAMHELTAAAVFFEQHGPPDLQSETRLALARLESRRGNHDVAWTLAQQALSEVETRVRKFVDVAEQQRFLLDKLRYYDHAFDIGLASGDDLGYVRAWTVAERSKSFYLAQLMANADVELFAGVDPALIKTLRELEEALDACERQKQTAALTTTAAAEASADERYEELSGRRAAQLQAIMKANPRWVGLRNPTPFDAATLLAQTASDVTPLSYFWRTSSEGDAATLHVFSRDASGGVLHVPVVWQKDEVELLAAAATRLHGAVNEYEPLFPEGMTERVLPLEIRSRVAAGKCLLISPHGRLRGVPLHALPLEESIVLERWPVQYTPSLGIAPLAAKAHAERAVLLLGSRTNGFGDLPIPDVGAQLADLRVVWEKAKRDVRLEVLEETISPDDVGLPLEKWSGFEVLHFVCHGVFAEGKPLDSALRLGRDAVRGSELFATRLHARVVTLGACALGQRAERIAGVDIVSEEWIGLYLPLFYAGARSLVVSLWDAHADTANQFMTALHAALADDEQPARAFQRAVLSVRKKLPARWANWCQVGLPPN